MTEHSTPALNPDWTNINPALQPLLHDRGWIETDPRNLRWTHTGGASIELDGSRIHLTDRAGNNYDIPASVEAPLLLVIADTVSGSTIANMTAEAGA